MAPVGGSAGAGGGGRKEASSRHGAARSQGRQARATGPPPESPAFERYYKEQRVVPEEEWAAFMEVLRTPIPVVVRLNPTKPHWEELRASFEADDRWRSLPWFPNAWQCAASDYDDGLRTQCGVLNKAYALRFQESASLVPPLLLDVQPSDRVLDLCAAPGSKTLECLELMRENSSSDAGVVIANDADAERCFELLPLITRKARHPGTAVVLGSAAKFPAQFDSASGEQALFDRILCDVPCSGDGTLRRRPHCWKSWTAEFALTLHAKQLQILCRGLHLLKPGGRLVYSTCSLNPVENEAVVAAALARFSGDVSLVQDAAAKLRGGGDGAGLRYANELRTWCVPHPSDPDVFFRTWEEVPAELRKPAGPLVQTMFPPASAAELGGCIRLLPHLMDGSGFFVAVFQKREHRAFPLQLPKDLQEAAVRIPWRARNSSNRYEVVSADAPDVRAICDFYGLDAPPTPLLAEYNVKGRLTQLNLVNESLLAFLQYHLNCKGSPLLVAVGVPLFKLLDDNFMTNVAVPSRWRPALEGCAVLAERMAKRLLRLDEETMRTLLDQRLVPMAQLHELAAAGRLKGLDACEAKLGGAVAGLADGTFWAPCVITGLGLELYASSEELGAPAPTLLPRLAATRIAEGPGYVALAKPSGLRTEDALRCLQSSFPDAELVSRLDKQTSGCLLVPTDAKSAEVLTKQFSEATVRKHYLCLVWGDPGDDGRVDAPLGLSEVGGGSRYRAFVTDEGTGKASLTLYKTIWKHEGVSLLSVQPKTGRTHQIRCHLAHIGHPLVGDTKYGGKSAAWCARLPLHCLRLRATNVEGMDLDVTAPVPDDFIACIDALVGDDKSEVDWRALLTDASCID
eukprot:TRINITY_DN4861_c0_g2_i1.p1 TRINITY_DN4861_c0_g2~~TRINITY_DN4861_c0_g2_i1.p1  ORF type:complete len:855 (+),score=219.88 TRINITY_DN4861_c0_g2_i1:36-2600(+)